MSAGEVNEILNEANPNKENGILNEANPKIPQCYDLSCRLYTVNEA